MVLRAVDDEEPVEAALRRLGVGEGVSRRVEQFLSRDKRPMPPKIPRRIGGQRVAVGLLDRRRAERCFRHEKAGHAQRADDHRRRHAPRVHTDRRAEQDGAHVAVQGAEALGGIHNYVGAHRSPAQGPSALSKSRPDERFEQLYAAIH